MTVQDTTAPVVTNSVASLDRTLQCTNAAGIAAALALTPSATDSCSTPVIHLVSDVTTPGIGSAYVQVRTWNFTDAFTNTSLNFVQTITVQDTTAPIITTGSIALCYTTTNAAQAAALSATTISDCDNSPTVAVNTVGTSNAVVTVTATDANGNLSSTSYNTRIDNQAPVITSVAAVQGVTNLKDSTNVAYQGIVSITVQAADNFSFENGHPTIDLVTGSQSDSASFVNESPAGTYHYAWAVGAGTTNGSWTVTVNASDYCHDTTTNFTVVVDKTGITGLVELEGFVGASRTVIFVATTNSTVLRSWTNTLSSFTANSASFTLSGVPANANGLSAKTSWNLRKKVALSFDGNSQAVANFTGIKKLSGADLNGDNVVNFLDYSILGNNFYTVNPVADIDGDGQVNYYDYILLYTNYFTNGDPQ